MGIGTSSPRSLLTIEGGLGAYFTSSGLLGLGTTTPWKSSTLSIEQNGVNPLFTLGDTGTTTPFLMVTAKGIISFGSTSPILLNPSDFVLGRNGITNDAYISGGLGIGNATTTDGILETLNLAYIGGVLKVKGTSTSTFAGPVELTATSTMAGYKVCTAQNGICRPIFVRKTADEIVNNSSTLQNDDALSFSIGANETWTFRVHLGWISNATADFKVAFTVPSGASLRWGAGYRLHTDGTTLQSGATSISTSGTADDFGGEGDNDVDSMNIEGIVVNGVTAGTVQLQWAQSIANVSDTTVKADSFLVAEREVP